MQGIALYGPGTYPPRYMRGSGFYFALRCDAHGSPGRFRMFSFPGPLGADRDVGCRIILF